MRYLSSHEYVQRGTFSFPMEFYRVDVTHPRYEMPFHWHMQHELICVHSGTLHLSVDGIPICLKQGDAMLIADEAVHGGTPVDCVYECAVFDLDRFLPDSGTCRREIEQLLSSGIKLQAFLAAETKAAVLAVQLFQESHKNQNGYEFLITGLLWQLIGTILRDKSYQPIGDERSEKAEQIKAVLRLIRTNYSEKLTLRDLAAVASLEPKYFCRIFRRITGRTPVNYLNYYRIECASELLCTTHRSITEIALACGFNDVSYFNRSFRLYKGMTAGAFRKLHIGGG